MEVVCKSMENDQAGSGKRKAQGAKRRAQGAYRLALPASRFAPPPPSRLEHDLSRQRAALVNGAFFLQPMGFGRARQRQDPINPRL